MKGKLYTVQPNLYALWWGAFIYVVDDDGELTLIDVGMFGAKRRIWRVVNALGYRPDAIRHILVTHADLDHIAPLAEIAKSTGARVYAGKLSARFLRDAASPPHLPPAMIPFVNFLQRFQKPVIPNQIIQEDDKLPIAGGVEVIATAGHTPDSLSFLWNGVLFSGDLFKYKRGELRLNYPYLTYSATDARASALKVLHRDDIKLICGGHDQPIVVASPTVQAFLRKLTAE